MTPHKCGYDGLLWFVWPFMPLVVPFVLLMMSLVASNYATIFPELSVYVSGALC